MKKTKFIMKIGSLSILAAPIITTVSCGNSGSGNSDENLIIFSGKSQIQDLGERFAKMFDNDALGQVSNGGKKTQFRTGNGGAITIYLAQTKDSKEFPSAFTSTTSEAKPYLDGGQILGFEDPMYNVDGIAKDSDALQENRNIAGDEVNKLIKAIQMNGRDSDLVKYNGKIVGFPSYKESIGLLYNKNVFMEHGLSVKIGPKLASSTDSINWNSIAATTANPKKIYTSDLDTLDKFEKLKKFLNLKMGDGKKANGIVTSGKESWAFTSKVAFMGISVGAKEAELIISNPRVSGDTTKILENVLTPEKAKSKLFNGATSEGTKAMIQAVKAYIKGAKGYINNNLMLDAFAAGNIAMMPQGSWNESKLSKTDGLMYGMLPFTIGHTKAKSIIGLDVSGHWYVADQAKTGRSSSNVIPFQTETINFLSYQYLKDIGNKFLQIEMGLLNPYQKTNEHLDKSKHPLLIDSVEYPSENALKWGSPFNAPGVGSEGFERHNLKWTKKLAEYHKTPTPENLKAIEAEMLKIWANSLKQN